MRLFQRSIYLNNYLHKVLLVFIIKEHIDFYLYSRNLKTSAF